jgi:hypothetical protein
LALTGSRGHARSPGAAIAIGTVVGLAPDIVVSLTTSVPGSKTAMENASREFVGET